MMAGDLMRSILRFRDVCVVSKSHLEPVLPPPSSVSPLTLAAVELFSCTCQGWTSNKPSKTVTTNKRYLSSDSLQDQQVIE